jgi:hypothetical protein
MSLHNFSSFYTTFSSVSAALISHFSRRGLFRTTPAKREKSFTNRNARARGGGGGNVCLCFPMSLSQWLRPQSQQTEAKLIITSNQPSKWGICVNYVNAWFGDAFCGEREKSTSDGIYICLL